jgi:hypothetical protein
MTRFDLLREPLFKYKYVTFGYNKQKPNKVYWFIDLYGTLSQNLRWDIVKVYQAV